MISAKDDRYQLECTDSEHNGPKLCSLYHANVANCTNLNYRKSDEPEWKCDYLDLDSNVVANGQIHCASPLSTTPEDVPFIYKKDRCALTYSLESITDQDPHPIKAFKDTRILPFLPNTKEFKGNYLFINSIDGIDL